MNHFFNVAPRYSNGSPALVSRAQAEQVVQDECGAYARAISGSEGCNRQEQARTLGLSGIVEEREMHSFHYIAHDMITGERRDSRDARRGTSHIQPGKRNVPRVFAHELQRDGGAYLATCRTWIQSHIHNGERVTWNSSDELRMSVAQVEDLASFIAASAINADRQK